MALVSDYKVQMDQRRDWRELAACRDSDPELFFPVGTTGAALKQIEMAKKVCNDCYSRKACLEFALITNQECGIWGGTSEDERRILKRQLRGRRTRGINIAAMRSYLYSPINQDVC